MKLIHLDVIRCQFLDLQKALAWISIQILSMARYITQSHYKIHDDIIFEPKISRYFRPWNSTGIWKHYRRKFSENVLTSGTFFLEIITRFSTHTYVPVPVPISMHHDVCFWI